MLFFQNDICNSKNDYSNGFGKNKKAASCLLLHPRDDSGKSELNWMCCFTGCEFSSG